MVIFRNFLTEFYYLFSEMAPYLLLGFLFAGLLRAFLPQKDIYRYLGKPGFKSSFLAAMFGVPMPLCSCGVIPTGVSLYKNGATKGATTSFMISTPQTGVDSVLATYALLGLPLAIIRPIVALITGVLGGVISQFAEKEQLDINKQTEPAYNELIERQPIFKKITTVFLYGFGEMIEDISKWLLIGLLAATGLSILIPDAFFSQYMGNPYLEMGIVLLASVPMYICATGSIPLAAVLLLKGLSPGAALVLLMAGPATNIATMTVIGKTMGRKSLYVYLTTIMGGALLFGILVNNLLPIEWFTISSETSHVHSFLPKSVSIGSSVLLMALLIRAFLKKVNLIRNTNKKVKLEHMEIRVDIEGMTCNHCEAAVQRGLQALDGTENVTVDLTLGNAVIKGNVDVEEIESCIEGMGYKFRGVESN